MNRTEQFKADFTRVERAAQAGTIGLSSALARVAYLAVAAYGTPGNTDSGLPPEWQRTIALSGIPE